MNTAPILILQHDRAHPPAYVGDWLARRGRIGWSMVLRSARDVPDARLLARAGALLLLDAAPARDPGAGAPAELACIRRALERGLPVCGIGHGAHLLTRALGGALEPAPHPVRGWFPLALHPRAARAPWLERLGVRLPEVFMWHHTEHQAPPGALPLFTSTLAPCPAYVHGSALALGFHAQLDRALFAAWLAGWRDRPGPSTASTPPPSVLAENAEARLTAQRRLADGLFASWLDGSPAGT